MAHRSITELIISPRAHVLGRRAIALFGAVVILLTGAIYALAVHDEGFQLEGNVEAIDTSYLDIDDTNPGNPVNTVTRAGDLCLGPHDTSQPAWQPFQIGRAHV